MRYGTVLALAAAAALAAPAGFEIWSGAQTKSMAQELAGKVTAKQNFSSKQLANYGNHSVMVAHREGDGEAELHETQNDVFIVQSGNATLVVGGTVVNPRNTAAHEIRGSGIQGGEKRSLGPGDIVHIPAKVAHQVLLPKGNKFTYAVVKIDIP